MKIFIYGYGNPGRQDDGLGILFVDKLYIWVKKNNIKNIFFDSNYQLNIEDSFEILKYDLIIFVDASKNIKNRYVFSKISPEETITYTSHSMLPENILFLTKKLYNKVPEAYLLTIKGYRWEVNKKPTKKAIKNLMLSVKYIKNFLKKFI
ncbi:MAG: homospermidine synthase [Candidatus Goldbacteria bacterium]|nr:homospermidine synthase [Candidatus Goldiibacteriota bacterium]